MLRKKKKPLWPEHRSHQISQNLMSFLWATQLPLSLASISVSHQDVSVPEGPVVVVGHSLQQVKDGPGQAAYGPVPVVPYSHVQISGVKVFKVLIKRNKILKESRNIYDKRTNPVSSGSKVFSFLGKVWILASFLLSPSLIDSYSTNCFMISSRSSFPSWANRDNNNKEDFSDFNFKENMQRATRQKQIYGRMRTFKTQKSRAKALYGICICNKDEA